MSILTLFLWREKDGLVFILDLTVFVMQLYMSVMSISDASNLLYVKCLFSNLHVNFF